jgi:hypothetical protein
MIMKRQANLFKVIHALNSTGRFPGRLHSRKEQSDQDTDDGNHNQKFNQGKAASHMMLTHKNSRTVEKNESRDGFGECGRVSLNAIKGINTR